MTTTTALLAVVQGWLLRVASTIFVAAAAAAASAVVPAMLLGGVVDVVGWRLCCPTAMQNCWSPANCAWMVARLSAWLFTVSCVAAYAAPKFARDSPCNAMEPPLLSMAAMP